MDQTEGKCHFLIQRAVTWNRKNTIFWCSWSNTLHRIHYIETGFYSFVKNFLITEFPVMDSVPCDC